MRQRLLKVEKLVSEFSNTVERIVGRTLHLLKRPRVVLIIPAQNEEKTIRKVIRAGKKSKYVNNILVVDSYSTDKTVELASKEGVRVVKQSPEKKGKGGAIYTGIKEAKGEIFVFMDADIENIKPEIIDKLVKPIIKGRADHVIGNFELDRGRVTKLTALPLLNLFFPEIKFKQPLSGLFATKSYILKNLEIKEGWGVEAALIIDIIMKGYKTEEVELGKIVHTANPMQTKVQQAHEIAETIVQKAHEYGRIGLKMQAVILATRDVEDLVKTPGSLIREDSKLVRILNSLEKVGITDVLFVVSYRRKLIEETIGKKWKNLKFHFIENKKWNDDLLSLLCATKKISRRFILFFHNPSIDENILEKAIKERGEFVICAEKAKGEKKILVEEGKLVRFTDNGNMFLIGLGVFEPRILELAKELHKKGVRDIIDLIKRLAQKYDLQVCDISK